MIRLLDYSFRNEVPLNVSRTDVFEKWTFFLWLTFFRLILSKIDLARRKTAANLLIFMVSSNTNSVLVLANYRAQIENLYSLSFGHTRIVSNLKLSRLATVPFCFGGIETGLEVVCRTGQFLTLANTNQTLQVNGGVV